jgi:hypothetical protein
VQVLKNGRDRGIVKQPAKVAGPLSNNSDFLNSYRILGIAAGFQHSLAIVERSSDKNRVERTLVEGKKSSSVSLSAASQSDKKADAKVEEKAVVTEKVVDLKEEIVSAMKNWGKEADGKKDKMEAPAPAAAAAPPVEKKVDVKVVEKKVEEAADHYEPYNEPLEDGDEYYDDYEDEEVYVYADDNEDVYGYDEAYADTYDEHYLTTDAKEAATVSVSQPAVVSPAVIAKAPNKTDVEEEDRLWKEEEDFFLGEESILDEGDLYLDEGDAYLNQMELDSEGDQPEVVVKGTPQATSSPSNSSAAAVAKASTGGSDHWNRHVRYASIQAPKNITDIKVRSNNLPIRHHPFTCPPLVSCSGPLRCGITTSAAPSMMRSSRRALMCSSSSPSSSVQGSGTLAGSSTRL